MFTGWRGESIMNQGSMFWADAGCLRPADDDHSQDDLQLLLESPTALAAQYNYFSEHLSGGSNHDHDPLRQNSLLGSPDFSKQLNMAGMCDVADMEVPHGHPRLLSLQIAGSFEPDSLLLGSSQEPQQAANSLPAPPAAVPAASAVAATQHGEAAVHPTYDFYQKLQQRQQQRYAVQNALHNRHAPVGWMVQLPADSMFHLPGMIVPHQQVKHAATGGRTQQQRRRQQVPVQMPAIEELPVAPPKKKRAVAWLPEVLRPVAVPAFGEQLPTVPVIIFGGPPDAKQVQKGSLQQLQQQDMADEQQQQQQQGQMQHAAEQPQHIRLRPKQQQQQQQQGHRQQHQQHQRLRRQPVQQQTQPGAPAAPAVPAHQVAADAALGPIQVTVPVSGGYSGSSGAAEPKTSSATMDTAAASGSSAVGLDKGTLVWAKFPRFPWWPAVIMSDTAQVTAGCSTASSGTSAAVSAAASTLVRFLGTYDAAWVAPKAMSRWGVSQSERTSKTKAAAFVKALKEATKYLHTGQLPEEFNQAPQLTQAPTPAGKQKKGRNKPAAPTQDELLLQQPNARSLLPKAAPAAAGSSPAVSHAHGPAATAGAATVLKQRPLHGLHDDKAPHGHAASSSAAHSSTTSSTSGASTPQVQHAPLDAKRKAAQPAGKGKRSRTGR